MTTATKKINYPYLAEGREIKYVGLDDPFMQAAKDVRDGGACTKSPTGAVVVRDGKIIGSGTNAKISVDFCPRVKAGLATGQDYSLCKTVCGQVGHAEAMAVKNAQESGHDTKGADLYLYGHWWCCKPCWDVMIEAGIRDVYLTESSDFAFDLNKIYVAGSLTHIKDKGLKKIYEKIGELCETLSDNVYIPHLRGTDPEKNPEVTPKEVWKKDFQEVATSDLIIAYVGTPSLGVGTELEWAREKQKKIILWWFEGDKVSRLPRGNPAVKFMIEAKDEEDLLKQLKQALGYYK